jgi:putative aldouronate transport system permease protein
MKMSIRNKPKKDISNLMSSASNLLINIIFIIFTILCIFPLILIFMVSITDEKSVNMYGYGFIPHKLSLLAYQYIFSDATQVLRSYGVSIFVTVVGSLVSLLFIALYAYPASRKNLRYKNFFSFLVFFTMLFNGGLVPWYMVYSNLLNLKDNLLVLIIPSLVTPFYVLIMKTFFSSSVPESILESAKIDGAGEFRIFFTIVLHLSLPGLATIGLFNTMMYWNDWFISLMFISNPKIMPLQFLMYRMQMSIQYLTQISSSVSVEQNIANLPTETTRMAMCIIAIGPIVFAYPFFQKYFIKGLTIGAIKG